ncbi:MAG: glutamate ABC transporter substrate-binding protein [Actinomycetota bacterium]|nr:glutamate ABC transporter substrate-binding protein [Actinomycetota bacterium]
MTRKPGALLGLFLGLALLATACGGGPATQGASPGATAGAGGSEAAVPTFEEGTTMAEIQQKGKLVVGTKFDQPLFGLKNPRTDEVEGFDVEIAKLIAEGIFGAGNVEGKIEFVETPSAIRESALVDGKVDMVVATYTINDERKQQVGFAGPYYVAGQDIMVKADNEDIKGIDDLNGKRVCTAEGSTSLMNLEAMAPEAEVTTFDVYSKCAAALSDGRVDAVTTDNVILLGLVDASGDEFKLLENPFTEEPYGIGVQKEDTAFRTFINDRLEQIYESGEYVEAFESTAGKVAEQAPEPPPVDRY